MTLTACCVNGRMKTRQEVTDGRRHSNRAHAIRAILSHAAGQDVRAGDLVIVPVDRCMTHDSLTPEIIDPLEKPGVTRIYDPSASQW